MTQLLTYGLYQENLKSILEVANGLACNCVCPNCKTSLIAKNNPENKKAPHFAHYSGKECEGAIESALHLLAKSILLKHKQLMLPDYHFDYNQENKESIFKIGKRIIFDHIILEKTIYIDNEKIIPDVIGEFKNKQILIEFAHSHFVNYPKKEKIKKLGIACIEIDLKDQLLDESLLIKFLNSGTNQKYWITNSRFDKEYMEYKQNLLIQKNIEEQNKRRETYQKFDYYKNNGYSIFLIKDHKIYNCPLKKDRIKQFKNSLFYQHDVIKRIVDGEYWNGMFYGYSSNGKWIYLNKEKITIYPHDQDREKMNIKSCNFLFAGLNQLNYITHASYMEECNECSFSVDRLLINNKTYQICKYFKIELYTNC